MRKATSIRNFRYRLMSLKSTYLLLPLLALVACSKEEPVEEAPVARPVKMVTFGATMTGGIYEYPGSVAPAQRSEMAFEVPGRIIEFPVLEGQNVKKGQVLARLDPTDYEASKEKAVAERNAGRAEFNRYNAAFKENAVTRQDLDLAKRNLEVAEANLKSADKAVKDTFLKAPFTGTVALKAVKDFANVQAKQVVLTLDDISSLEMKINIPEQDWARAKPGLSVGERVERMAVAKPVVVIAAIPDKRFPARLKEVATSADPVTRTYGITFAFDRPKDVVVRSGMTGKIVITIPEDIKEQIKAYSLPSIAVAADEQGKAYVWRFDTQSNTVHRASIEVGMMIGTEIRVLSGLSAGDIIAVSGVSHLREGLPVRRLEK